MLTALAWSAAFLAGYVLFHHFHGETHFKGSGWIRTVYLCLLASHIILAVVALPLVLVTFFFSLTGRIPQHRKVARWTFPLWLYVSVTGVITYVMLRLAQG